MPGRVACERVLGSEVSEQVELYVGLRGLGLGVGPGQVA